MKAKKVLFITQEIIPYVAESQAAIAGREVPQAIQESGYEIRTFMPKWGGINERRNQLHEVIRLSGMNIIVDDSDHPLIIKVASIQPARMQVYFIDNDDYFRKRKIIADDKGVEYADNCERAIFFARGVLETVKKLRWCPDVIICQGWIASIVPFFLRTAYKDEPTFEHTKVISTLFDELPTLPPADNFKKAICFHGAKAKDITSAGIELTDVDCLPKMAVAFSDAFVQSGNHEELTEFAAAKNVPTLSCPSNRDNAPAIINFLKTVYGDDEE